MTPFALTLFAVLRDRMRQLRAEPDAGYSTETVVVTALLVATGITILVAFGVRLVSKAQGISLG
jgi:hypothetical protein